jgi:hypothetical protein
MLYTWVCGLAVFLVVLTFVNSYRDPPLILLSRVPMIGLDFVLVALAGYKSLQHYSQIPDKTWSGARLMRIFARDSILYFFW